MTPVAKTKKQSAGGVNGLPRSGEIKSSTNSNLKERVLIEFPSALLNRADQAARDLATNRSDLIRNAVERLLDDMDAREFERDLAQAYAANAEMNRGLAKEFEAVDREGF